MQHRFYNAQGDYKNYWWVQPELPGRDSAIINLSVAKKYKKYQELKASVWFWYRGHMARKDIGSREKLLLYGICERYRGKSLSCTDSLSYFEKFLGMNRRTISKALNTLVDKEIVWLAVEGEEPVALKRLPKKRVVKHILLVGLNATLSENLNREKAK